jgi:sortase A
MLSTTLSAAERGGPFGRTPVTRFAFRLNALHRRNAPAGKSSLHGDAAESSPLGGARLTQRALGTLVALLAIAGAVCFGDAVWIHAKARLGQWLLQRAWDGQRATGDSVKPWPWADTFPIARLTVESLHADVLVLAGASGRTLAWGPGHLDDSAPLGSAGNAVVSAHRDTHFGFLRNAVAGDDIAVELASGARHRYRVRETYIAEAQTLRLPRNPAVPTLTLVTCYPFDALVPGGPLRYVVVAEAL